MKDMNLSEISEDLHYLHNLNLGKSFQMYTNYFFWQGLRRLQQVLQASQTNDANDAVDARNR